MLSTSFGNVDDDEGALETLGLELGTVVGNIVGVEVGALLPTS
jgi:hypothetical protein